MTSARYQCIPRKQKLSHGLWLYLTQALYEGYFQYHCTLRGLGLPWPPSAQSLESIGIVLKMGRLLITSCVTGPRWRNFPKTDFSSYAGNYFYLLIIILNWDMEGWPTEGQ
jgi:hypothetical protein